jgi:hypothetical protein
MVSLDDPHCIQKYLLLTGVGWETKKADSGWTVNMKSLLRSNIVSVWTGSRLEHEVVLDAKHSTFLSAFVGHLATQTLFN